MNEGLAVRCGYALCGSCRHYSRSAIGVGRLAAWPDAVHWVTAERCYLPLRVRRSGRHLWVETASSMG